ncbi:hypothetical protein KW798_00010 [Candidatus Parcubacteria bacterium]|nr:hypothetical protein [Candidatus Parcubacteria bacterium]
MPHIRAICTTGDEGRRFLFAHALRIRKSLSAVSGYELSKIALIPEHIAREHIVPEFNLDPIEFVIDVGIQIDTPGKAKQCALKFRDTILARCPDIKQWKFGVWVRSILVNEYVSYDPEGEI